MITLKIGTSERQNGEITERWINEQVRKRKHNSQPICVQLTINKNGVNLNLTSQACSGGGGGGRKPNNKEHRLISLWKQKHLNGTDINSGMIISFLNQYEKYL